MKDYNSFHNVILNRRNLPLRYGREKGLGKNPKQILEYVLERIRREGPLSSKNFEDDPNRKKGWWNRKPARVALDVLYNQGHLAISHRKGFQCYYDLSERVIPRGAIENTKSPEEYYEWAVLQSVDVLGVSKVDHIADYYRINKKIIRHEVEKLLETGKLTEVSIQNSDEPMYTTKENLKLIAEITEGLHSPKLTTFLSPFDNLIWHRKRMEELFGFHYRVEMYTPAAKRKFGYYVLPILHNGNLVGRMDVKADRQNTTLIINKFAFEPHIEVTNTMIRAISNALGEFAEFHRCNKIDATCQNFKNYNFT